MSEPRPSPPLSPLTLSAIIVAIVAVILAVLLARNDEPPSPVAAPTSSSAPASSSTPSSPSAAQSSAASSSAPSSTTPAAQPTGFPDTARYTGLLSGNASVAIVVDKRLALAYFCDGVHEFWLRGSVSQGTLEARGAAGQQITGTLRGSTIDGVLTNHGQRLPYAAKLTAPPGGIFQAVLQKGLKRLTWIIRSDGGQTGLFDDGQQTRTPPMLQPGATSITVDGQTVPVRPVPVTGGG